LEDVNFFFAKAQGSLKHPQDRKRAEAILLRWTSLWTGPRRAIACTYSNHGAFLHFDQLIGTTWSHVFTFHAAPRHGLSLKGPDPDRMRKSHKFRANPLDRSGLDGLFAAWAAHPEARPAGNAVEFFLEEASDDVWEACLQEALIHV
jgi:hypothetical protein